MHNLLKRWTTRFESLDIESDTEAHELVPEPTTRRERQTSTISRTSPSIEEEDEEEDRPLRTTSLPQWSTPEARNVPELVFNADSPRSTPPTAAFTSHPISMPSAPRMTRTQSSPAASVGLGITPTLSSYPKTYLHPTSSSMPLPPNRFPAPPPSITSTHSSTNDRADDDEDDEDAGDDSPGIHWRIRLDNSRWDFEDSFMMRSNTRFPLAAAKKEPRILTEIKRTKISREALTEAGYRFDKRTIRDTGEWGTTGETRLRAVWQIQGALAFTDVAGLIKRTKEIDEGRKSAKKERKSSMRSGGRGSTTPNRTTSEQHSGSTSNRRLSSGTSSSNAWPAYLETMEERDEDGKERRERRERRMSFGKRDEEMAQERRARRRESDVRRESYRATDNDAAERRERKGSTRDRNVDEDEDGNDRNNRRRDHKQLVGAAAQSLGLLTLIGGLSL
jgi:hypothetical protein